MTSVFAIDPGSNTGFGLIEGVERRWSAEIQGWHYAAKYFEELLIHEEPEHIVMEWFDINETTHQKTREGIYDTLFLMGAILHIAYEHGLVVTLQSRNKKKFGSNDKLKRLGWWHIGGEGHANDALRHAAAYMHDKRLIDRALFLPEDDDGDS